MHSSGIKKTFVRMVVSDSRRYLVRKFSVEIGDAALLQVVRHRTRRPGPDGAWDIA